MIRTRFRRALALCALLSACGDKIDAVQETPCQASLGVVTYEKQVKPLLEEHCTSCHSSGRSGAARNGAPPGTDFDTLAQAKASASAGLKRVQNDSMPPGTKKLATQQKQLFACWIEQELK